jgi:hypothetical protein
LIAPALRGTRILPEPVAQALTLVVTELPLITAGMVAFAHAKGECCPAGQRVVRVAVERVGRRVAVLVRVPKLSGVTRSM